MVQFNDMQREAVDNSHLVQRMTIHKPHLQRKGTAFFIDGPKGTVECEGCIE